MAGGISLLVLLFSVALPRSSSSKSELLAGKAFIFYYLGYGNPGPDGKDNWEHWDHEVLPHWKEEENSMHPSIGTRHAPGEGKIHAPFFPLRGTYSSKDPKILMAHFQEIRDLAARANAANDMVVVFSWWGPSPEGDDPQGVCVDTRIKLALEAAQAAGVEVAFQIETTLSADETLENAKYLVEKYGKSPAVFKAKGGHPVFFIHESGLGDIEEWREVLVAKSALAPGEGLGGRSVKGVFVGLWKRPSDGMVLSEAGFDAFYTLYAHKSYTFGSTPTKWRTMVEDTRRRWNMSAVLGVGPGYMDERIRPYNRHVTQHRQEGHYYSSMWRAAIEARPDAITINSFNDWGHGTQIEPVETPAREGYLDYGSLGPSGYLNLTSKWLHSWRSSRHASRHASRAKGDKPPG